MDNKITQMADSIPALIKNTHLNVNLQGWPAAITAVAFFGSYVAINVIKVFSFNSAHKPAATESVKEDVPKETHPPPSRDTYSSDD